MTGVLWLLAAILLGCLLVYRWVDLGGVAPFGARVMLTLGAGAVCGIGLTSVMFFLAGVLMGSPVAAMVLEVALLGYAVYEAIRAKRIDSAGERWSWLTVLLAASVVIALAAGTAAMTAAWEEIAHGNWDAWATWNLRARYLASGSGLAVRAWSPLLNGITHIEYPLLIPAFVARCWSFSHATSMAVPAATSYVFFLALIAMVAGGVMALRGTLLGLAAALILACTPSLLREVPGQYADVPVACYMAGALTFVLLDRPWMAGILAGLALWTKNEGMLFLAALLVIAALLRRRALVPIVAGALPAGILTLAFKLSLPKGTAAQLGGSLPAAIHQAGDVSRYTKIIGAFVSGLADMGIGWYHPLIPMAILAVALRFDRRRAKDVAFSGATAGLLLLGFFAVYTVTAYDLTWQLQTSMSRLLVQAWPLLAITLFVGLAAPEATPVEQRGPSRKANRKAAKSSAPPAPTRKKGAS